jgi:hypothetical protein
MISSFLDNAERLATRDYGPTDDDIVRARLRTLDIQEYELNIAGGTLEVLVASHQCNKLLSRWGIANVEDL